MLKFFRKIRQKLLQQNRVTRYLVYAIGEIFLVVIGILIALQVNNWNENRKKQIVSNETLKDLQQEIIEARSNLKEVIAYNKRILRESDLFLVDQFGKDSLEKAPERVLFLNSYRIFSLNTPIMERELTSERMILGKEDLHKKLQIIIKEYQSALVLKNVLDEFWNNQVSQYFIRQNTAVFMQRASKGLPIEYGDIEKIISDQEYKNIVATSNTYNTLLYMTLNKLDQYLTDALTLIDTFPND